MNSRCGLSIPSIRTLLGAYSGDDHSDELTNGDSYKTRHATLWLEARPWQSQNLIVRFATCVSRCDGPTSHYSDFGRQLSFLKEITDERCTRR